MPHRFRLWPLRAAQPYALPAYPTQKCAQAQQLRPIARYMMLSGLLLFALLFIAAPLVIVLFPGLAWANSSKAPMASAEAEVAPRAYASYIVQLEGEPLAALYADLMNGEQVQSAALNATLQAHLATVDQAQLQLVDALSSHEAEIIYRVQRVYNGVAIHMPSDQIAAIAALPGVQAVYPLIPKEPTNARVAQLLEAPTIWEGIDRAGLTGEGIRIAIIDTGIDYLHTMFGGPGTGYNENNPTIIGDVPNFPGIKVAGGYDFAGDTYNANIDAGNYQPIPAPDPDPMDCYGFGHGTHVAGTAAGYGVQGDGTTYGGPYDNSINFSNLRIGPGMAPQASLYALKVFGCAGSSDIVDLAIEWAVDPNQDGDLSDRMDVINLSLGSSYGALYDSTSIAVENAAKLGVIVVTSAGNTGDVHYAIGSPGVAERAITVAASTLDGTGTTPGMYQDGGVASFSARGPRRGDHFAKPDVIAPGANIISARRSTGNQSVSSSGTSMASPVVAGVMALLRQAYAENGTPGWRNQELKALLMNTARVPFVRPIDSQPYSLLRVGAGRIDLPRALQSQLIAYDATTPEQVSVNFGMVEVLDNSTQVRSILLANKSTTPITVTVGYIPISTLPGVTIDVSVSKTISIPALGYTTTSVTLTVDAQALTRRPDPTRQLTPINSQQWLDEASGYITFSPTSPISTTSPTIHLPILALPRAISALNAMSTSIDISPYIYPHEEATFPITITGRTITPTETGDINTGITNTTAPTQSVPLLGVFGLAYTSPPITQLPNGDTQVENFAHADLRYVGTLGPLEIAGQSMLYFALVSYGPWSTPMEVSYRIEIDVDNDGKIDYRLKNLESTDTTLIDIFSTDDFASILEAADGTRKLQGPLNIYPANQFDTRPFNTHVMILPLKLADLEADSLDALHYRVVSITRDIQQTTKNEVLEQTPFLSFNASIPGAIATDLGSALAPVTTGDIVALTIAPTRYRQHHTKGVLLLFLHNNLSTRVQVLPVEAGLSNQLLLPRIYGH